MLVKSPRSSARAAIYLCCCAALLLATACGPPPRVNIELRRRIQSLESEIQQLQREREGHIATIRSLEQRVETVPTLPQEQLDQLFTTHGIRFGRLTGGVDLDPSRPGNDALRIYIVPVDAQDDPLKAAGSFNIEAFDLTMEGDNRLGRWEFSVEEARQNWVGELMMYNYALTCPWQRPPQKEQVTVRVTFRDALTGREFTEQREVRVKPPTNGRKL